MTGFKTTDDFRKISDLLRRQHRFFPGEEASSFFSALSESVQRHELLLEAGSPLWRAQIGFQLIEDRDELEEMPFPPDRMKPPTGHTVEGRINPRGIPFLYLAQDKETAICEVRPWLEARVSLGEFRTSRKLKIVDFTKHKGKLGGLDILLDLPVGRWENLTPDDIEQAVWADIELAFARPVGQQDEHIDYVPTQVIAELLRHRGFDGVRYRSAMNDGGYNIALFDLNAADMTVCRLFIIKKISYEHYEKSSWARGT
jgi:hypothetical protein